MKFRPCIDLHEGKVKQIVGSSLTSSGKAQTNFETDAKSSHFAHLYQNANMFGGHVIMLGPGNEEAALEALQSFPGGLQIGGGINPSNALRYLQAGASHVIVTSFVFKDGKIDFDRLQELVSVVSKEKLVLDLSCRKRDQSSEYFVVTDRWEKFTDFPLNKASMEELSQYCSEFLIHAVDVEGKREGMLLDLVEMLSDSPIPVTYAGGARNLEDLEVAKTVGRNRVDITIGSALDIFGGDLSFEKVIAWNDKQRVVVEEQQEEPKIQEIVDFIRCKKKRGGFTEQEIEAHVSHSKDALTRAVELGVLVQQKNKKYTLPKALDKN